LFRLTEVKKYIEKYIQRLNKENMHVQCAYAYAICIYVRNK
jgi:hypothetical protein